MLCVSREQKFALIDAARRISAAGLTPLTQGNLSLRDRDSGLVLITPHDFSYDCMTCEDLVTVTLEGDVVEGWRAPSFETPVHLQVYERRPEVHGIVHAEPVYTNCFGVVGKPIAPVFLNAALYAGGEVPVMPFAPSGSREFADQMLTVMGDSRAVIWANHGLLAVGNSIEGAVRCAVMVELAAKIYFLALQCGEPATIPSEELAKING